MAKPANKKPTLIKPMALKGFREWLPEEKILEQRILDTIRSEYEAYGFVPIETAAVERNEILLSKGGLSTKEIYQLTRLAAEPGEKNKDRDYSLHFDLTVPFARYTAQNFGKLVFPFKRYQIQKVCVASARARGASASSIRPTSTSSAAKTCRSPTTPRCWR
jgi:histidyl-tRNA synthetase